MMGIAAGIALFILATRSYPGGTTESATTVGYSWAHNYISSLFTERALNGAPNSARGFARSAMLVFCASLAFLYHQLGRHAPTPTHRRAIEITGIGTAVYSFLVVTPMHNLMVTFSLLFGLAATLAIVHALHVERRWLLALWGAVGVALTLVVAVMYYGHLRYDLLPTAQKASLAVSVSWILATYYAVVVVRPRTPIPARRAEGG